MNNLKSMSDLEHHLFQLSMLQCRLNALEVELSPSQNLADCFERQAKRMNMRHSSPAEAPQKAEADPVSSEITEVQQPETEGQTIELVSIEPESLSSPSSPHPSDESLIPIVHTSRRKRKNRRRRRTAGQLPQPETVTKSTKEATTETPQTAGVNPPTPQVQVSNPTNTPHTSDQPTHHTDSSSQAAVIHQFDAKAVPLETDSPPTRVGKYGPNETLVPASSRMPPKSKAVKASVQRPPTVPTPIAPLEPEFIPSEQPTSPTEEPSGNIPESEIVTDQGLERLHSKPNALKQAEPMAMADSIVPMPKDADSIDHFESSETLFLDDLSAMLSDIPDELAELPSPLEMKPELDSLPNIVEDTTTRPASQTAEALEDADPLLQSDEVMLEIINDAPLLHEDLDALSDQIDLQPDNMSLWLARAKLWHHNGDLAAAISDCYRAMQLNHDAIECKQLLDALLQEANIPQYRSLLLPQ